MIRAGLYAWNRGALVVLDDATTPPAILEVVDFDASTADPAVLAVVLGSRRVERFITIAPDGPHPAPAQALAQQLLRRAGVAGIAVATVGEAERKAGRGQARKLLPIGTGTESTRDALAVVLADLGATFARPVPVPISLPPEAVAVSRELAEALGQTPSGPAPAPSAIPDGPRFAGIDPGARHVAVVVGASTPEGPRYVASKRFDVGRMVALRTPKPSKIPGRPPVTHRRVITDEDVWVLIGDVATFLADHDVERIAVERASFFHRGDDGSAVGAQSALLLRAQWVGGELAGALRSTGKPVVTCSSAEWRAAVRGGAKAPWKDAVRALWGGTLPAEGEHVLDAAGAGASAVMPARAPRKAPRRPKIAPDKAKAPKPPKPGHAALLAALAAHGRPIRLDVLAVRMGITTAALRPLLTKALASGAIVKPAFGQYALPA